MSSSPLGVLELYDETDFADNEPLGARAVRDGPLNNAMHWADQRAQVLVNWASLTSSGEGGDLDIDSPVAVDTDIFTRIAQFARDKTRLFLVIR